ncbi:hypothetical protein I3842_10G128900 [Carya illinoinensis]|uniref:Uncharacterized protein n=1 Tax=Carya illinoinensis TaxID=32201 RepID=A0A922J433_CARIL|nr:hypothetical protein I3842_10G128900 [Carya illinoinensis]
MDPSPPVTGPSVTIVATVFCQVFLVTRLWRLNPAVMWKICGRRYDGLEDMWKEMML